MFSGRQFTGVEDLVNNPQLQGFVSGAFNSVGKVCSAIGTNFDVAFVAVSKAFQFVFDFIKFDIFVNYFQQIGLWFNNLAFPQKFKDLFHKFVDFLSFMWDYVMNIPDLNIFYIWGGLTSVLLTIWLIQKMWDPLPEIKGPNQYGWQQRGAFWNFWTRMLVTILTTLYLPCMTSVFRVLFCFKELMIPYELTCYEGKHWYHMGVALFVFLYIGLYLPYHVYVVINMYQPKPHKYDEMGNLINVKVDKKKYNDQYRTLLTRDTCPYNFLYSGYEYGWSLYKVITMIFKILLLVPLIPFFTNMLVSASVSLGIVSIYGILSMVSTPFILPQDDWIDLSARFASISTISVEICVLKGIIIEPMSTIILSSINGINVLVMAIIFLGNLEFTKNFFRKRSGTLVLTPGLAYNPLIDRRQRIWQRFWRGMLATYGTLKPAEERLAEMESLFTQYGSASFKSSLLPPSPELAEARKLAQLLEGVDAYWKGTADDPTYFGKLFITPFPFMCNIIYDESDIIVELGGNQIVDFVNQNLRDPKVVLARKFRQMLRCLNDETVNFRFSELFIMKNGFEKEEVLITFNRGILRVTGRSPDPFSSGFRVTIEYEDGEGVMNNGRQITNYSHTISHREIGINNEFSQTPELLALLNDSYNMSVITKKWDDLQKRRVWYQEDLDEERREHEEALSYNFWMAIFFNDKVPRSEMEEYILYFEQNANLHDMLDLYEEDFDGLYKRLELFDSHPAIAFWMTFFDDVSLNNHMLNEIEAHPELFDMTKPTALAYHPCPISQLKSLLEENGLRNEDGTGIFNDEILNGFDLRLRELCVSVNPPSVHIYVPPLSPDLLSDPRCQTVPISPENRNYLITAFLLAYTGQK